jgi:recombination protein RecR
MNSIDKLAEIFSHFPGIGPRQARRFVYYLLSRQNGFNAELISAIENLKRETAQCQVCLRYFPKDASPNLICNICKDPNRDNSLLMVVPRDVDLDALEKSRSYKGYYFVLGGALPILEKEPQSRIRLRELVNLINQKKEKGLSEIILAMNANTEGENTSDFLKEELAKILNDNVKISVLGRGLSTGSELEYADPDTLKNALLHRTNE